MLIMKNIILVLFAALTLVSGFSQSNMVINPSFEMNQLSLLESKQLKDQGYLADNWYNPLNKNSPHIFKFPNKSVAKANSGLSSVGLILGGSKQKKAKNEYITGELTKPLVKGKAYCVSFNLLLHRSSRWAASNVGVIFHHNEKLISDVRDLDKIEANLYANDGDYITNTKWQKYNGYFVASGGEKYLSFGIYGEKRCY
jgi:hypothetical protein